MKPVFTPDESSVRAERPARPSGVSILTIWFGIAAGITPLVLTTISLTQQVDSDTTGIFACIPVAISAGIMFTAIGAWRGHDPSRLGFIIFVLIYYSLASFNEFSSIRMDIYRGDTIFMAIGRIVRFVAYIIINTWYFLRPKTIEFYRRRKIGP